MEKYYLAALSGANGIGYRRVTKMIEFFGSAETAWKLSDYELEKIGLPASALNSLLNFRRQNPDFPEKLARDCTDGKMNLCTVADEDYPPILKEIQYPPPVFYYRGKLLPEVNRIAMVGSRKSTNYGERAAFMFAEDLAAAGLTVVSGAAYGIDTCAHRGALKTGRTVAVLGNGLNWKNNPAKEKLLDEIAENGVVISEFEPNMQPSAITFPPRNRIIAGLCAGVIVVEAGIKSGALITTNYAADYGRDVFAIPGSIFSEMSKGCNKLLYDGAKAVTDARDVLEFYSIEIPQKNFRSVSTPTPPEKISRPEKKLPVQVELKSSPELPPKEKPEGKAAEVFDAIPPDDFITSEEILIKTESVEPGELPRLLLQLELRNYIVKENEKYKRI